jgi:hypothetical protein
MIKMKIIPVFALLFMLLLAVLPSAACQSTAPIEKAVMCSAVNQDGSPKETGDIFPPDIRTIFCSVKLRTVSNSANVKGDWYIVNSQQANLKGYYLGGETAKAEIEYVVFAFERSSQPLPAGDYEVRLSYENQQRLAVPFKIQGNTAASIAKLGEAVICSSIDMSTEQPIDKWDVIPDDAGSIFCSVRVDNATFADFVGAEWKCLKGDLAGINNGVLATRYAQVEGRKNVSFSINLAEGKRWFKGDYQVKLMLNNTENTTVPFKIVDAALLPGPYLSEAVAFVWGGTDNQTMNPTNIFPASTETINIKVKANNCPDGTEALFKWILVQSADGIARDLTIDEKTIKTSGTSPLLYDVSRKEKEFPRGRFVVKILLDGTEKMSVPFQVR